MRRPASRFSPVAVTLLCTQPATLWTLPALDDARPSNPNCTLQQLRKKAEERNPDEFYFAMEKARTVDGVHVARSTEANKYSQVSCTCTDIHFLVQRKLIAAKALELGQRLVCSGSPFTSGCCCPPRTASRLASGHSWASV